MKTGRFIVMIIGCLGLYAAQAIQYVDVGFESPTVFEPNQSGDPLGTMYSHIHEDNYLYYGLMHAPGTNWLWISGSDGYRGTRSFGTRCYAFNTPEKDRAEFRSVYWNEPYALTFGQTMFYGYAMKIATSSMPTNWMHIMQAWQGNCGPKVPITLSYDLSQSSQWKFKVDVRTLTSTTNIGAIVFSPGVWHSLVWKLNPSYPGFGGGSIDLWVNGTNAVSWTGNWGVQPGVTNGEYGVVVSNLDLRCGIYRGHQAKEQILLFDQVKYADSYYEADPAKEIDWGFRTGTDGWTVRQDIVDWVHYKNCVDGDVSGKDPSLYSPDNLNRSCSSFPKIYVKMRNATSSTLASMFFTTTTSTSFTSSKQVNASIIANDANYTIYQFDMSANANWTGTLKRLRFDPANNNSVTSGWFSIDFVDLSE